MSIKIKEESSMKQTWFVIAVMVTVAAATVISSPALPTPRVMVRVSCHVTWNWSHLVGRRCARWSHVPLWCHVALWRHASVSSCGGRSRFRAGETAGKMALEGFLLPGGQHCVGRNRNLERIWLINCLTLTFILPIVESLIISRASHGIKNSKCPSP